MVRILDRNNPVSHESVADRSGLDSEDDDVEYSTNENYTKAEKEWNFFETFKVKVHRPSVAANTARTLGNVRKISVGPLDVGERIYRLVRILLIILTAVVA